MYTPVGITAGASSLDIAPAESLDPELFVGERLKPGVRMDLLSTLTGYFSSQYQNHEQWLRAWLAGSGVSFRWHAAQDLKDLDVLLGVQFVSFRNANPGFLQLGNTEIAKHLNDGMRSDLWPYTAQWRGQYEVTWYVNPGSWDITSIKPYAAYDLVQDGWTVPPTADAPRVDPQWEVAVGMYSMRASTIVDRYSKALTELQNSTNPAARANAERQFRMSVEQAVNLFDTVHEGRRYAFSGTGEGYDDWGNYLWQMGKKAGWIPALRQIKDYHQRAMQASNVDTYGVDLPDSDTLIRRAALMYR